MRTIAELSQPKLAKLAGISDPTAVSRWENDHHAPSSRYMYQLAKVFGVSLDVLRGSEDLPADWKMPRAGAAEGAVEVGTAEREVGLDVGGMTSVLYEHIVSLFVQANDIIDETLDNAAEAQKKTLRMKRAVARLADAVDKFYEASKGEFRRAPESKEAKKLAAMLGDIRKQDMERAVRVRREWEKLRREGEGSAEEAGV